MKPDFYSVDEAKKLFETTSVITPVAIEGSEDEAGGYPIDVYIEGVNAHTSAFGDAFRAGLHEARARSGNDPRQLRILIYNDNQLVWSPAAQGDLNIEQVKISKSKSHPTRDQ